jgi:hypothetical protein
LFDPEVTIGGSSATRFSAGCSYTGGIPVSISVACISIAVFVVIVVLMDLNIATSDKSHLCTVSVFFQKKLLISYLHFCGLVSSVLAGVRRWFEHHFSCIIFSHLFASVVSFFSRCFAHCLLFVVLFVSFCTLFTFHHF